VLSSSAQKVQDALRALGHEIQVVELPASTRTSSEAAQAVGCQVGQIAKTLVFKTVETRRPVLVIASGANRVNEERIKALVGEAVEKANADFVRERTGFAIGGVPPVGHPETVEIYIDQDLLEFDEIWAAAGTPHAVFRLTPKELARMTGGTITVTK
jgi:prolyl-tRNA editing enzyme YbaK/EbsC (Cys-tRNA(Pro) deacylase)